MSLQQLTITTDYIKNIEYPENFKINLFDNQILISNFLKEFEINFKKLKPLSCLGVSIKYKKPIICISDPVGSGKSYALLSFLKLMEKEDEKNYTTTFIIVSFKLVNQWIDYLNNTDLNFEIVATKKQRETFCRQRNKRIVLFSNTIYSSSLTIVPDRIIVDEIDTISRPYFYLPEKIYFISSTYTNIDIDMINIKTKAPNILNDLLSPPNIIEFKLKYTEAYYSLLTRLNINKSSIIQNTELNNYKSDTDFIDFLYKDKKIEIKKIKKILNKIKTEKKKEPLIEQIKNLKSQIQYIRDRILNKECLVCLGEIKNKVIITCCCIVICDECADKLDKCVYCKKTLNGFDINKSITEKFNILSNLEFNHDSKIIILGNESQIKHERLNFLSSNWFDSENDIITLNGGAIECNRKLKIFKENKKKHILYFRYMADVSGFNLEYVTDIVLLCDLSDTEYTQILGRAQRYGRTSVLNVYKFIK